jgi:DNA-binding beta-propeller fold protein YncE
MNTNKFRFIISAIMVLGFLILGNKAFAAPYDFETLVPANNGLSFTSPIGLTKDSEGNIYVTDIDVIKKFSSAGILITVWGGTGTGNGEFSTPIGMAIHASGNIYVADSENNRVQVFTSTGGYLFQWGSGGTGNSQFNSPVSILAHSN